MLFLSCSSDNSENTIVTEMSDPQESSSSEIPSIQLPFVGGPIIFTEVDPINMVYEDHEGGDAGWVELFNTTNDSINLKGTSLTNSLNEPAKWVFGDVIIPPQSFMLVFLSGKNYPDFVAPRDSASLIGSGCWSWTDSQNEDVAGESYSEPLEGKSRLCFSENGQRMFGARMRLGENKELGWSSISSFVGTKSSDPDDVLDITATNEILMKAYISKDRKVSFRLVQTGIDDWKGYEMVFTGTGDSSTVYRAAIPTGKTFPDLSIIYGTRMSPQGQEKNEVTVKVFSYLARNRGHEPHSSFKVKNEAGSLYLINENSEIMDSVAYPAVPIGKSWSLGKNFDGSPDLNWGYAESSPYSFTSTTVVSERSPSVDSLTEIPLSGFYNAPFVISFDEHDFVHCSEGGSAPSDNSPIATTLLVSQSTVVRCASFIPGKLPGEVVNRTYMFEDLPKVPVFFIVADPGSLFDPDSGIYMEGNNAETSEPHFGANYWLDKEVPVNVEFFEPGMNHPAFSKNAGLKIFGNYSRQNEKKSVSITFREKYGDNRLKYPLFSEFPELKKFKSFILRNNGSNFGNDYIRDRLSSSLSEGLGVDYQRGRSSIVYYNGSYFGIHNIRERSTEYYFETHYGYDPDQIDLLKADNEASAGSSVDYTNLMDWIENHDMSKDESLDYVSERMDLDNFMNYMQTEIFINNRDWPANNLKKWRCENPATKWKWFIYDTDFGFGNEYSQFKGNVFEFVTAEDGDSWPNGPEHTFLLRKLLENPGFKASFINRMCVLLSMNFSWNRSSILIEKLMGEIESEIARDQKRWKLSASRMNRQLDLIKKFGQQRPLQILSEMQEFFGLGSSVPVLLSVSGRGSVLINGLKLDSPELSVNFFTGVPVLLTAVPEAGGVWTGWSDGEINETRVVMPGEVQSLMAVFR